MRPSRRTRPAPLRRLACAAPLLAAAALLMAQAPSAPDAPLALLADVEGAIGPATSRHLEVVLRQAESRGARLVILRMDTPGGLSDSMREMIKAIIASPVPVVTWVGPSGARAASAGTYILYASHVAAMAPGTNLGAATPVQIGGLPLPGRPGEQPAKPAPGAEKDGEGEQPGTAPASGDALERKAVNDAEAYIRSLAQMRGRNAGWAARAVREAASLPAAEALEKGVVDVLAPDIAQLLAAIDGRSVQVAGEPVVLRTAGLRVEEVAPSWQLEVLAVLTNPNVAFILLMVGVYGLIFEFSNPGSIGPGVAGVICLLLGLYALNLLPLDYAGLGLLLLGVAFMVAEAFTPSFGVLGVGGLIAFVVGASILLDSDSPHFRLAWEVIAGTAVVSALLLITVVGYAVRAQRRPVTTGAAEMLSAPATVLEWDGTRGFVQARGERWAAQADESLEPGTQVRVTAVEGLMLQVRRDGSEPLSSK